MSSVYTNNIFFGVGCQQQDSRGREPSPWANRLSGVANGRVIPYISIVAFATIGRSGRSSFVKRNDARILALPAADR
jgi:hypothetical protein